MNGCWRDVICVDWGKDQGTRSAWVGRLADRSVAPTNLTHVSLTSLLEYAERLHGPVLLGFDAALGVPKEYFVAACAAHPSWNCDAGFLEWLSRAVEIEGFFDEVRNPIHWAVTRPYIAVPAGKGALNAFWEAIGYRLQRRADERTGAKSPFIVSGIPGTVGSGSRVLWQELAPLLHQQRKFGIWPFEGKLSDLFNSRHIVIGEIYPRVAYGAALAKELPTAIRSIAKTHASDRAEVVSELFRKGSWIHSPGIRVEHTELALESEDHFDAMMSVIAMLRCALEGRTLEAPETSQIEGGILGLSPAVISSTKHKVSGAHRPAAARDASAQRTKQFPCPIEGCTHVFRGSRGGWDSHVGSVRRHPHWMPEIMDSKERKQAFVEMYERWFC